MGSKVKTSKIIENIPIEYERQLLSVVDGENLLILLTEPNKEYSIIKQYKFNGTFVNEIIVDFINVNGIAFTEKLNQIYLSYVKWDNLGKPQKNIVVYNNEGKILKNFESDFKQGFFTEDGKLIGYTNKSLICFDAKKLEIYFEYKLKQNYINLDVTYNSNKIFVASARQPILADGKWLYENPEISEYDLDGHLVESKEINSKPFTEYGFETLDGKINFKIIE